MAADQGGIPPRTLSFRHRPGHPPLSIIARPLPDALLNRHRQTPLSLAIARPSPPAVIARPSPPAVIARPKAVAISTITTNGVSHSALNPGGRWPKHRDCRVAIAPRNDRKRGAPLTAIAGPSPPAVIARPKAVAISTITTNGVSHSAPNPGGRWPKHRDCRVAVAPRNDSC